MLRILTRIILCSFLLIPAAHHVSGCGFQSEDKVIAKRVLSNKIRYKRRWIDILIDERDFTVNNLKVLMNDYFKAYPRPERLCVSVFTDISQLGDLAEFSDPSKRPAALHPSGGLYREKEKDLIRYRFPNEKLQTIIIKEKTARNRGKPQSLIRR